MEKRALLAAILSLAVLYVWSALFPAPKPKTIVNKTSQAIEINQVTAYPKDFSDLSAVSTAVEALPAKDPARSESLEKIESETLTLGFSDLGGSLQSALINQYEVKLPAEYLGNVAALPPYLYKQELKSGRSIKYSGEVNGWRITKKYSIKESHLVFAEIEIENISKMSKQAELPFSLLSIDIARLDKSEVNPQDRMLFEYSLASGVTVIRKHDAFKFSAKEKKAGDGAVDWLGFRNKYFATVVKPEFNSAGYEIVPVGDQRLEFHVKPQPAEIQPGQSMTYSLTIYSGPQDIDVLKSYGLGLEKIVIYSNFGLIDAIAKFIYMLMHQLHRLIPIWGICIILTSLAVYLASYPLTIRGMSSMKKMQSLQPEMAALKEKHKNNPQKLNQEVVELYRKHKINPFGGCVMFLLQTPIFIALYQVLWRSISFKGEGFLWIKDLSLPDRLFVLPYQLPVIGNELNLLPLLMGVVMFFQQKLSAKAMVVTDPSQLAQQKMMQVFFPIFLGFMFYHFASGLTIYFTMFYLLSTLTQFKMMKAK